MSDLSVLFQEAIALHDRGDFAEAAERYGRVLAGDPSHVEALFRLGRAHCQQGRLAEGVEQFRKALQIDPKHARSHNLLGMALLRLGRPGEALPCFDAAITLEPDFADAMANKGDALAALGRYVEAVRAYDRALALSPGDALTWTSRAVALQESGRSADALASLDQAIEIDSVLFEAHANRGKVLTALERYDAALASLNAALVLRPEIPELHFDRGVVLGKLRRFDEAAACLERALALRPDYAEAHMSLGDMLRSLDRQDEAIPHYEYALRLKPDHAATHHSLGANLVELGRFDEATAYLHKAIALAPRKTDAYLTLSAVKPLEPDDPVFAAMRELASDVEPLAADDQVQLHFALGKAYANIEEFDSSIRHFLAGNSLKRKQIDYDERAALGRMELARSLFSRQVMRDHAGRGDPSPVPVFIVGMPRSGSTLVEQILVSHPQVFGAGERRDFTLAAHSFTDRNNRPDDVPALSPAQLRGLGAAYLAGVRAAAPEAKRITDKMPGNFLSVGFIHLALPNAKIIHTRRDPADNCFSCFSLLFGEGQYFTYDLAELGRYYRAYDALMRHWQSVLPEGVMLDVQYEQVVEDLEAQARRIVAHCGLEWDDRCLAFHEAQRSVRTASATQVRRPIYRTSVNRWQRHRNELKPLLQALGLE